MKKIMFNDRYGLTDAVLKGLKTMTRRIAYDGEIKDFNTDYIINGVDAGKLALCEGVLIVNESKYKIGEVVAVAQTYKDIRSGGYPVDSRYDAFRAADFNFGDNGVLRGTAGESNKMFVRADLMPHQIRITGIKVERLQDISNEDCLKEGIGYNSEVGFENGCYYFNDYKCFKTPKSAFGALINRISGKGTWEKNPYVFAYTFKLIK